MSLVRIKRLKKQVGIFILFGQSSPRRRERSASREEFSLPVTSPLVRQRVRDAPLADSNLWIKMSVTGKCRTNLSNNGCQLYILAHLGLHAHTALTQPYLLSLDTIQCTSTTLHMNNMLHLCTSICCSTNLLLIYNLLHLTLLLCIDYIMYR